MPKGKFRRSLCDKKRSQVAVLRVSGTFIMPKGKFKQSLCEKTKQGFNCAVLHWLSAQGKFQRSLCDKKTGSQLAVLRASGSFIMPKGEFQQSLGKKPRIQLRCFKLVKCPEKFQQSLCEKKKHSTALFYTG